MSEHLDNPLPPAATDEARRLRGELDLLTKSRDAWEAEAKRAKTEAAAQRDERLADCMWRDVEIGRYRDSLAQAQDQAARAEAELYGQGQYLDSARAEVEDLHAAIEARDKEIANLRRETNGQDALLGLRNIEIDRLKAELAQVGSQPPAAKTAVWQPVKPQAPGATPALDIAACVRLLAVADPADLEPVVRTAARLLRGGGAS